MPPVFTDQMGHTIELNSPPRRIISLVPSQTELLFDLGLQEDVIGITKFCVHPKEWHEQKMKIGGTKSLRITQIIALQPDLIIGNKEENDRTQIETLTEQFPVWMSDILTIQDAFEMITQVGALVHKSLEAVSLCQNIEHNFQHLSKINAKVAYFIWRKLFMAAASNTYIHEMLSLCGMENVFKHLQRYPEITPEMLKAARPDAILLSSEPYPFKEKHIIELQAICPQAKVILVDGEFFSWYGSRMLGFRTYIKEHLTDVL